MIALDESTQRRFQLMRGTETLDKRTLASRPNVPVPLQSQLGAMSFELWRQGDPGLALCLF